MEFSGENKNMKQIKFLMFIILNIILLASGIPIINALTEFVDDYHNENYIAIKNNVIRNPILNAIELNYSIIKKKKEEYERKGYFYTTQIINDVNGSFLILLTNSTLDKGIIKVQFSNDNSTWLNHNNQTGYDYLIEGFESIDLRDLNFSNIYLKFNFKREGKNKTPRLYQIRLISKELELPKAISVNYYSWIIFLIVIGLMLLYGVSRRK